MLDITCTLRFEDHIQVSTGNFLKSFDDLIKVNLFTAGHVEEFMFHQFFGLIFTTKKQCSDYNLNGVFDESKIPGSFSVFINKKSCPLQEMLTKKKNYGRIQIVRVLPGHKNIEKA